MTDTHYRGKACVSGLLAAVVIGLGFMTTSAVADTRLIVNCFWPPQHHMCSKLLPGWIEQVEAATEGRVRGIIPPKSVAPPPEQLASVEKGIVDVSVQFNGLIGNRVSGPLVAMTPFIGNFNAGNMSRALWQTNRKYFPDEFDTVQLLSQWVISPGQLFSLTDTPVNSIEDLSSRKIWALPGPLANITKELGSGVVSTPAVKANEIISRGVVDASLGLDQEAIRAFQLLPYAKSMTRFSTAVYTTSFSMFINQDTWAEISEADQAAIMAVSGESFAETVGSAWDAANASAEKLFTETGISVVDADPAFEQALIDASTFVGKGWITKADAAGIDGQGAMDFYKSKLEELSE